MATSELNFESLWSDVISERRDPSDPAVPRIFSSSDMPIGHSGISLTQSIEDAEFVLLVCRAASHSHSIDLFEVGGEKGRNIKLYFPSFEGCCQHPMLSHINKKSLLTMRDRCHSDTIMTLSFVCNVTPAGRFIVTGNDKRVVGTNIEEDRILCVTSDSGRVPRHAVSDPESVYTGVLHRLFVNSREDIERRLKGFSHSRCENVARSAILALLKIGEAMVLTVDNVVTAVKSGVPEHEIVWQQRNPSDNSLVTVRVNDLKSTDGFDVSLDCEPDIDPLAELLLTAANRQILNVRKGFPPRANLFSEPSCIERRMLDYFKQTLLNNPSHATKFSMRVTAVEGLVLVSGLRDTLWSLCTSSLATELAADTNAEFYSASKLEELLGVRRQELEELSRPLIATGNRKRTRRTKFLIDRAVHTVANAKQNGAKDMLMVRYQELMHDPEVLHHDFTNSGDTELDLLRISDHVIECGKKYINHDTEVRMFTLLLLGADIIRDQLNVESCAIFYGITVRQLKGNDGEIVMQIDCTNDGAELLDFCSFVNLNALHSHVDVFKCMLSLMGGQSIGELGVKNPARCIPERSHFVGNAVNLFREKCGLTRAQAVETAVLSAHVLSVRRTTGMNDYVMVDSVVSKMMDRVRGCLVEAETDVDVADTVTDNSNADVIDHYGVDSTMLQDAQVSAGGTESRGFKLLDYMTHCERYGKLNVVEDAVAFSEGGQRMFAYCRDGRVFVRKRGVSETPRRWLGDKKIGLTVLGTGLVIELKKKKPKCCDDAAMDLIMFRAREGSPLATWVWAKILKGHVKFKQTQDSCLWNEDAADEETGVIARWAVPKWVLRHMLVMVQTTASGPLNAARKHHDWIMVQAGDDFPVYKLMDNGLTRYSCKRVELGDVDRRAFGKAMFEPELTCAGDNHLRRFFE